MFDVLREIGFDIETRNHAEAILSVDFPSVSETIVSILSEFSIEAREIIGSGGGQAASTMRLRDALYSVGWPKHEFVVRTIVDGKEREAVSHEIDHVFVDASGTLALEIEWNNKDPFFDRDLENFQRLHEQSAISLGILITRGASLQNHMVDIVEWVLQSENIESVEALEQWGMKERTARQMKMLEGALELGQPFPSAFANGFVSDKYGQATTHWDKLMARVHRGVGNPCPMLLIGLPVSVVSDYSAAKAEL